MIPRKVEKVKEAVAKLRAILPERFVLTSSTDLALYECDAETLDLARPDIVVLPSTTEEVSRIMKVAAQYNIPITPRGAGTGLSGGATTVMGGISIPLTRMTRVLSIDPDEMVAHVEAGITNVGVTKAVKPYGLYFAPDPSSQIASTIGGNLAENAGGAHTLKYGMTSRHVTGARVVMSDGEVITVGGPFRSSLGLDLTGVLTGSEGTLGIVTEAWVRLTPLPQSVETMLAYFPSLEAGGEAVSSIIARGIIPAAMEMIDRLSLTCVEQSLHLGLNLEAGGLLIVELDGPRAGIELQRVEVEHIVQEHGAMEVRWAHDEHERMMIWKARKTAFGALGRIAPHGYVLDGVIPRSRLREAINEIEKISSKYSLPISNIYHAGDGNLHPCLLYHRDNEDDVRSVLSAAKEILEMCVSLGGTLSGEHGIGIEKLAEMPFAFREVDLEAMRKLRRCFDPSGICNPGKVVPAPKSCGESGMRPLLRHKLSAC
jgi:glycolate oxidase subunit GlcD